MQDHLAYDTNAIECMTLSDLNRLLREKRKQDGITKASATLATKRANLAFPVKADRALMDRAASLKGRSAVYFIRAGRFVKIGTSTDVLSRLSGVQTGCPIECQIVGLAAGGRDIERALHEMFAPHRTYGEWFRYTSFVEDWITRETWSSGKVLSLRALKRHRSQTKMQLRRADADRPRRRS